MASNELLNQIKFEEGFSSREYICPAGKRTIGFGHSLDAQPYFNGEKIPDTITREFAEKLLHHDVRLTTERLHAAWHGLSLLQGARHDACVNMAFQLGVSGFLKFKLMRQALVFSDWKEAHKQALLSKWALTDTPERAERVAGQFLTGKHYQV